MGELLVIKEAGERESHAAAARGLCEEGPGVSVVVLPDVAAALDERGGALIPAGADDVVALASSGQASCVCARVRGDLVPAALALASGDDGAPLTRDGAGERAEAHLWAAADLAVALAPLPSGAASGVTGVVAVEDRVGGAGACRSPFRATEAGTRIGSA